MGGNDGDGDIFTELLATCSTSAEAPHEKPKQSHQVSNSMTVIDVASAVLFEPGLRTFLPIGDRVISCRASNEAYVLSMFHQIAPAGGLDTVTYSALPAHKITVSLSSLIMSLQESRKSYLRNDTPRVLCVQPRNSVSFLPSCTAIERSLFNKLFNSDASLLDSPVIIFGGQDGQVHFWPINSFAFNNVASENLGAKQSVSPQLLYHLEQGVSAIYVANLPFQEVSSDTRHSPITREPGSKDKNKNEPCSGYCNAVVFVGEYNKVVIASERQSFADKGRNCLVDFSEHAILGPVICSCLNSNGDMLIHSTGKEIFFTKLSLNGDNSVTASLSTSSPVVLTAVSFQLPNVNAVCCVNKKKKAGEASSQDKVYAFTINGKLVCFNLPDFQDGGSCIDSDFTAQMAGEKVKRYLSEIETQSTELCKVSAALQSEGDVLKELNRVIHIACELSEHTVTSESLRANPDQDAVPLFCTFTPMFANLGGSGNRSVTLHCKVVNQGSLPLSSHWSLMIRVHSKEPWLNETNGEGSTLGQSMPLTSLRPGSSFEVDIPLGKSLSSSFHVLVEADLYCDLNAIFADLRVGPDSGLNKPQEDVVIPVSRQVLDILHFVMPNQIEFQVHGPSVAPGTKEQLLLSLSKLNSKNEVTGCAVDLSDDRGTNVNQESTYHGSYSATFYLSQDAVCFMMNAIQKMSLEQKLPQVATPQATVLHFILRDSSISNHLIHAECQCMDLLTVNGSCASIRVKPLSESTVEVLLQCPLVHLLCRLHEAVLTRLKVRSHILSFLFTCMILCQYCVFCATELGGKSHLSVSDGKVVSTSR